MRFRGYLTAVVVMGYFAHSTTGRTCGPGQLLDPVQDKCLDCPDNEYNEDENHTNVQCRKCTPADHRNYEKVLVECNKTHDSVIGCIEGRYRTRNDCDICTNCSNNINGRIYTSRECTHWEDTTCTDKPVTDPDSIITTSPDTISSTTVSSLDNVTDIFSRNHSTSEGNLVEETWTSWYTWVIVVCGCLAVIAIIALSCNTCGIRDKLRACLERVFPCRSSKHQEPNNLESSDHFLQEL